MVNHPGYMSDYYFIISNLGVKQLEPNHFNESLEKIETHLIENNNEKVLVSIPSEISEQTRLLNLISELRLHDKFEVDDEKQKVKLTDEYYNENKNGNSFF